MSFKDRMIENEERGFCSAENSYEYTREQMADAADQARKAEKENPPSWPVFMVGDRVTWDNGDELGALEGTVTRADLGASYVVVKLEMGGTFTVERSDLRRA